MFASNTKQCYFRFRAQVRAVLAFGFVVYLIANHASSDRGAVMQLVFCPPKISVACCIFALLVHIYSIMITDVHILAEAFK